jgi:hypothetical protein
MNSRIPSPWRPALAVLALASACPLVVQAAPQSVVVRDAETGQLRAPTAEEAKALTATTGKVARNRLAAAKTEPRTLSNGAVAMDLDESTLVYSVVRRNADGTISRVEVQGKEAAEKAAKAPRNFTKPMTAKNSREAGYELK